MRILIVSETLVVGGAETFVVRLCNELSRRHQVMLLILHGNMIKKELLQQVDPYIQLVVVNVPLKRIKQKADSLFYRLGLDYSILEKAFERKARDILTAFNPQIVHTHLLKTDLLFARVKEANHFLFKQVSTIHGDYSAFYNGVANARIRHSKKKIKYAIEHTDKIVCLCQEHLHFFREHFAVSTVGKLHLVYNGYRPIEDEYQNKSRKELKLPEKAFIFGMVSRGVPKKGWEKAIESFLEAKMQDSVLVLVGWSDYMASLKEKYSSNKIIFAGFSANPVEYIQHFDVCLLPTLFPYESLPTVVMEYLYCGKPVIATDVGEISTMITGNGDKAGWLLRYTNHTINIREMVEAMKQLYTDNDYYHSCSKAAKEAFQKFDMAACVASYETIYRNTIEG